MRRSAGAGVRARFEPHAGREKDDGSVLCVCRRMPGEDREGQKEHDLDFTPVYVCTLPDTVPGTPYSSVYGNGELLFPRSTGHEITCTL